MTISTVFFARDYSCIVGMYSHERIAAQKVFIELKARFNNKIDEKKIIKKIEESIDSKLLQEQPFLLERLVLMLGDEIITLFLDISCLEITIKKPKALAKADNSNITLCIKRI